MRKPSTLIGILLTLACILCAFVLRQYQVRQYQPQRIQQHIQSRVDSMAIMLENLTRFRPGAISHVYKYYTYNDSSSSFWNDETYMFTPSETKDGFSFVKQHYAQHIVACTSANKQKHIIALPIIQLTHPLPHLYPKGVMGMQKNTTSFFLDTISKGEDVLPISLPDGKKVWLHFNPNEWKHLPPPILSRLLALMGIITYVFWSFAQSERTTRKTGPEKGLLLLLLLLVTPLIFLYSWNIPEQLEKLPIFSPLLFSSTRFIPSLGHLLFVVVAVITIVVYLIKYRLLARFVPPQGLKKYLSASLLVLLTALLFVAIQYIAYTLVFDSGISLQITRFSVLSIYSFLLITTIAIFFIALLVLIAHLNYFLHQLKISFWQRLLLRLAIICVLYFLLGDVFVFSNRTANAFTNYFSVLSILWYLLFLCMVDVFHLSRKEINLFNRKLVFWALFSTMGITLLVHLFNTQKERMMRLNFAESLLDRRDHLLEWELHHWMNQWIDDSTAIRYSEQLTPDSLISWIKSKHPLKYPLSIAAPHPNTKEYISAIKQTEHPGLIWDENDYSYPFYRIKLRNHHLLISPPDKVRIPSPNRSATSLQMQQPQYAFALYEEDLLRYQNIGGSFPSYQPMTSGKITWTEFNGGSLLLYKLNEKETIGVYGPVTGWWNLITLFSYFFCSLLLTSIIVTFISYCLLMLFADKQKRQQYYITFTARINYVVLLIVIVVLFLAGWSTQFFLKRHYVETQEKQLYALLQQLQLKWKQEGSLANSAFWSKACLLAQDEYRQNKVFIDYYGTNGEHICGTYSTDKNIPTFVRVPLVVILESKFRNAAIISYEQKISGEVFQEVFSLIQDGDGHSRGFVKLAPDHTKKVELNGMLDSIALTTVNIYTLIFLIMVFASLYFSKTMSRSLNFIIEKFAGTTLEDNILNEWPRDDEIGRLMRAYNKMALNLQDHARRLKLTERESAWREMAQQVAHEIKNPLTPMKLNIQYLNKLFEKDLQTALRKAPDLLNNLIYQIDQLNIIASEFSNFAQLPHAHAQRLELQKAVKLNAALFSDLSEMKVICNMPKEPLYIMADPIHFNRVMTNLIKNAKQAIPEGRKGVLHIEVEKREPLVLLRFTDNGSGIPEAIRNRMFEPQFTTKGSGTGLGLAMTKKMVEEMGGNIRFESETNIGTTFLITLPLTTDR